MDIKLYKPFTSDSPVDPRDVKTIKRALNRLGYYQPNPEIGMNDIPDAAVFKALGRYMTEEGFLKLYQPAARNINDGIRRLPIRGDGRANPDTEEGIQTLPGRLYPDDPVLDDLKEKLKKQPQEQKYIWRSVGDDRVRDSHAALEGTVRSWRDSPDPGEEENCRCWAEFVNDAQDCHALAKELENAYRRMEGLQKSLSEAIRVHNQRLEEWKKAEEDLRKIAGQVAIEVGIPSSRNLLNIAPSVIKLIIEVLRVQKAMDNAEQAKNSFESARKEIDYLRNDINGLVKEIDGIKRNIENAECL